MPRQQIDDERSWISDDPAKGQCLIEGWDAASQQKKIEQVEHSALSTRHAFAPFQFAPGDDRGNSLRGPAVEGMMSGVSTREVS
jgi:hypothetical protein